jgi:hypothetical protein
MPLTPGKSKTASSNVGELRKVGYKLKQALAIAYKEKRKGGGRRARKSKSVPAAPATATIR